MRSLPFLLDTGTGLLILLFVTTQIVIPLWRGRKLFPFFRTKDREIANKTIDLATEEMRAEKLRELNKTAARLHPETQAKETK